MAACQEVRAWINKNVLIPVEKAITESREVCTEIKEKIEEKISKPVEKFFNKVEKVCKKLPWPLSWFCKAVTVVVKVIEWVVETVIKWVITIVCQVITFVIGFIIELVLKVIAWLVTFVVCIFTDFGSALKSIYDLWVIVLDAVDAVVGFVETLLTDVVGILDDLEDLIDSVAESLGWLGVLLGLLKALVGLVRRAVEIVRDLIKAVKDIVLGILSLNLCRVLRGVGDLGGVIGRLIIEFGAPAVGAAIGFLIGGPAGAAIGAAIGGAIRGGGLLVGGVRDSVQIKRAATVAEEKIRAAFGGDEDRIERSLDSLNLATRIGGLPITVDPRRMFLSSTARAPDLRALHNGGIINLYALAGYASTCRNGFSEVEAEAVYAGTQLRVTVVDIDTYLASGPDAVPEFHVFPITRVKFREYLDAGIGKARLLGLQIDYAAIDKLQITQADWIPLAASEADGSVQDAIFQNRFGRVGAITDALEVIPTLAHFHYVPDANGRQLFGLTSWFRPSSKDVHPSGVTFRNLAPSWFFRWVAIHEIGHYMGLNHPTKSGGKRGLDEIMYSPASGEVTAGMFAEYLLLGGEPRFTFDDIDAVWTWVTTDAADRLLP